MHRLILIATLVLLPAGVAFADPDIGCGPGTQIWAGNSGLAPKVLGATTNGTFGLQTFGITFGTLGCGQGGTVTVDMRLRMFTDGNLDQLARDMAHGQGEALTAFSHLLGIAEIDEASFGSFTQAHFAEIFATDDVTSSEMLASVRRLMANDAVLGSYVGS